MKIGTRGSELALWQARRVRALLQQATGITADLVVIQTTGDKDPYTPLTEIPGKQFFTKEIEDSLLDHRIDLAVHSLKDLQTEMPDGLWLAAVPERADRRDMLLIRHEVYAPDRLLKLMPGARVGTSSSRRLAQLRFLRPDLVVEPMRGNIPRRIGKLRERLYDVILVAAAGIDRLEHSIDDFHVYRIPEFLIVPAPGQGALAVQVRADDEKTRDAVARIDEQSIRGSIELERDIQRQLEGGCQLALGVSAKLENVMYRIRAFLGTENPAQPRRIVVSGILAEDVKTRILDYLKSARTKTSNGRPIVWITRGITQFESFSSVVSPQVDVVPIPVLRVVNAGDEIVKQTALEKLGTFEWLLFTSGNAVRQFKRLCDQYRTVVTRRTRIAAIGRKTAQIIREAGWNVDFASDVADARSFVEEFTFAVADRNGRVLFPCGAHANQHIEQGLEQFGFQVERLECYDTVPEPGLIEELNNLPSPDAIVSTSPRAARFLLEAKPSLSRSVHVSIGPATSEAILEQNCAILYEACDQSLEGTAEIINGLFAT